MSTFAQVTTQKGEFDAASFVSIRTSLLSELQEALGKCLEIAANDFEISQMCYQSVFNSDYYWEWIKSDDIYFRINIARQMHKLTDKVTVEFLLRVNICPSLA